jgi:integrase
MASLSKRGNGRWFLRFIVPDGRRRTIALGTTSERQASQHKLHIENLLAAQENGLVPDPKTVDWLAGLSEKLRSRLEAVGLLSKPEATKQAILAAWIDRYTAMKASKKGSTHLVYGHTRRCLVEYFGADKPLTDITAFNAEEWRTWLAEHVRKRDGKVEIVKLGKNTVNRRCGIAKQFFAGAVQARVITANPFDGMAGISKQVNTERFHFVSRTDAQKVLDACPDAQWRLLFALSRYGGLRCPSEHLGLRWCDVRLAEGRMTVRSPKTEHHEGRESREVPIFNELRRYLEDVLELAESGTFWVITRYRQIPQQGKSSGPNLRTQLLRILDRAGVKPWPKLFQNLRSTRQTELAEQFPAHVVCAWMGNSRDVAREHYLQVTDEHFAKAASNINVAEDLALHFCAPDATQIGATNCLAESQPSNLPNNAHIATHCTPLQMQGMGGTRLELVTPSLSTAQMYTTETSVSFEEYGYSSPFYRFRKPSHIIAVSLGN